MRRENVKGRGELQNETQKCEGLGGGGKGRVRNEEGKISVSDFPDLWCP